MPVRGTSIVNNEDQLVNATRQLGAGLMETVWVGVQEGTGILALSSQRQQI